MTPNADDTLTETLGSPLGMGPGDESNLDDLEDDELEDDDLDDLEDDEFDDEEEWDDEDDLEDDDEV